MAATDPAEFSLSEAAELIRARRLSPVELVEAVLARIDHYEPHLNAYITVLGESAQAEARAAEAEIAAGRHRGPLHGIPIAVKDLINTAGVRTTMGSKIYSHFVPDEDAVVVRLLREAGSVIVGKTNLHEFALGSTTINPHYGPTHNPWGLDRVPGGSSGGSAAAVASHLCLGALGTDTGGSVRGPSGHCGLVGLKPTYGLVSRRGVFPMAWSLDHIGPMTKTVADAALLLNVLAGHDPMDPASAKVAKCDYSADLEAGVRGLRIGVLAEFAAQRERIDGEVWSVFQAALKALAGEGAEVTEVSVPSLSQLMGMHQAILHGEGYSVHEKTLRERAADYGEDVRFRLLSGGLVTAAEYIKAQRVRGHLKADFKRAFDQVDLVAIPTSPEPAPKMAEATEIMLRMARNEASSPLRLTPPFNHSGLPAISVPAGFTKDGLPIGMQLAGPAFADALVLRSARALERTLGLALSQPRGLNNL